MKLKHEIYNPNNIILELNDYYFIPFGHRCTSAMITKFACLRKWSLPFDWCAIVYPNMIKNVLENDFKDFIPDVKNNIFTNKYNFKLHHFNININEGINEYTRRIDRFRNLIKVKERIYFVYVNEDYLYNVSFRDNNFNKNIFNQMLELESFLKKKYININFTILYFDFVQHQIPKESNIINIVLKSDNYYEIERRKIYRRFRNYCGVLLSEMFNTKFIPVFTIESFRK
jgi:hypothetical protein